MADARDRQPETELEAALYLFENGGNYKVAYDAFRSLYRRGFQRETLLELMTQLFTSQHQTPEEPIREELPPAAQISLLLPAGLSRF